MKQMTFADAEYAGKRKQTRKELFLIEMDRVVPWKGLVALIEPHYPKGEGGRPSYPLMVMLRVHLMQNWFGYSDPAMEEALYETTILRQFARLRLERIPDETTILNFRRLLEKHELAAGILAVINGYLGDRGLSLRQDALPWSGQEHGTTGDAVRAVKSVDGAQTFTDKCRRGTPVIWVIAAARCSRRLETQKLAGDLIDLDRFAAFKIVRD